MPDCLRIHAIMGIVFNSCFILLISYFQFKSFIFDIPIMKRINQYNSSTLGRIEPYQILKQKILSSCRWKQLFDIMLKKCFRQRITGLITNSDYVYDGIKHRTMHLWYCICNLKKRIQNEWQKFQKLLIETIMSSCTLRELLQCLANNIIIFAPS